MLDLCEAVDIQADEIRLVHIAKHHVFTSPDVPELHVSDLNQPVARDGIQSAPDMIGRMKERLKASAVVEEYKLEALVA